MKEKLQVIQKEYKEKIKVISNLVELEEFYQTYFSRKSGILTLFMKDLKNLNEIEKREIGALANDIKNDLENIYIQKKQDLEKTLWEDSIAKEKIDISQPKISNSRSGHLHPVTLLHNELEDLFTSMGFIILDGPELESDYYNFEALNVSKTHPARDSHDTFFIKDHSDWVMRTHTSSMQVRAMQKYGAPLRAVGSGRVFRNEATDACHEHTFYQMEGLVVDKKISIDNVIAVMKELLQGVFKREIEVRLRPGYFPFVEPGFELDMKCLVCGGKGCGACKHSGWIETLPCGLIHPKVIKAGGLDPNEYQGFAFGLGSMRLVMQKYGIEDIRYLHEGNMKFLEQF
ncbi:MAG: phenylalanine--tRNA ligase subunit alpha [Patescibacteria group bacterium]